MVKNVVQLKEYQGITLKVQPQRQKWQPTFVLGSEYLKLNEQLINKR